MDDEENTLGFQEAPKKTRKKGELLERETYRLAARHRRMIARVMKINRLENKSQALRFLLDEMVEKGRG